MERSVPVWRKLVFSAVVLVVALAALEGLARAIEAWSRGPARTMPEPVAGSCPPSEACFDGAAALPQAGGPIEMVEQRRAGWGFEPGSTIAHGNVVVTINALGLRGPDLPAVRDPDEIRLLALGDSSVFGYGVTDEQWFLTVAAGRVAEATGRAVRPVNGALPGYSTRQARAVLDDVGRAVDPDWVVIACVWSDLYHAESSPESVRGPTLPLATVRLLERLLAPARARPTIGWWDPGEGRGTPGPGRSPRVALTDYMDNLHALARGAEELGARPVFVILPAPVDLDPAGPPPYVEDYRSAMATVAAEVGAPLVDGPRWFEREGATAGCFFDQVHPSAEGHAMLGEALAKTLLESGS